MRIPEHSRACELNWTELNHLWQNVLLRYQSCAMINQRSDMRGSANDLRRPKTTSPPHRQYWAALDNRDKERKISQAKSF